MAADPTTQVQSGAMPAPESPAAPNTEANQLEKILPQIKDLARQVGGYRKLAELIHQLDSRE
jgi:hypothetical protein